MESSIANQTAVGLLDTITIFTALSSLTLPKLSDEQYLLTWFAVCDWSFEAAGVTNDRQKFSIAIRALSQQQLRLVSGIVEDRSNAQPYETLKKQLPDKIKDDHVARFEAMVKPYVEREQLRILEPSEMLKRMRELADGKVPEEILEIVWMNNMTTRLRERVNQRLMYGYRSLDSVALSADFYCMDCRMNGE